MNDATESPVIGSIAPLRALARAVNVEDWVSAVDAVRTGWFPLAGPEAADEARGLLERVPPNVLRCEPLLAMMLGILLNQTRFQRLRALRYFVMAVRAARSSRSAELTQADRLFIRSSESAAFRLLGRTNPSVSAARAALQHARSLSDGERASIPELARIFAVLGVSFYYGGLEDEALRAAELGLAEASTTPPSNGMGALALLCGIHALRGDLIRAQEHLVYARSDLWTDRQRDSYSGVFYRVAEAIIAVERLDVDVARSELERLRAMTTGRHANEHWVIVVETQALIELAAGHPGRGLALLEEMVELRGAEGSHRTRARLARIRSLLQLALGNPDGAAVVLKRDTPSDVTSAIERARIALTLGQTGTALAHLRAVSGEQLTTRQAAELAAIDAAVLLRISDTPRRAAVVQRLGELLERSGQRLAIALLPQRDHDRVVSALGEEGFRDLVSHFPSRSLLPDIEPATLLTRRELAVLDQLMRTASIAQIASSLVVSSNTVKSQIRGIYRKLGASNREDAIAVAMERHLLTPPD